MGAEAIIWTEGKTDWQHLKRAFQALRAGTRLAFEEFDSDFGDDQLLKQCAALARVAQPLPTIFIFDRDNDWWGSGVIFAILVSAARYSSIMVHRSRIEYPGACAF